REGNPEYRGELYAFYIYQEEQNKGVGKALFLSVLRKLEESGINSLMLWVFTDNPYRRFYEKMGGYVVENKLFEMEGFSIQITAYGWPDIGANLRPF
ncbi:MAG: GNAT family N-acetyltransferase, partial [Clostridiaceae bacterium]